MQWWNARNAALRCIVASVIVVCLAGALYAPGVSAKALSTIPAACQNYANLAAYYQRSANYERQLLAEDIANGAPQYVIDNIKSDINYDQQRAYYYNQLLQSCEAVEAPA